MLTLPEAIRRLLRRPDVLACLLLAAVTLGTFTPVLRNGFVNYDDGFYVTANEQVKAGLTLAAMKWACQAHTGFWHPLTWLSLQLDTQLYGLKPAGFHLTNLLLHLLNVLLVFVCLRRLTGSVWRSATVAALFALHPLHVETVAWVSERKGLLSTFFALLALLAYASYARRPGIGRYVLVLGLLCLGLMAKPMLVTLPAVFLLLDYWPLARLRPFTGRQTGLLLLEKLPWFALALVVGWATVVAEKDIGALAEQTPLADRLRDVPVHYLLYLGKTALPLHLSPFYPRPVEARPWSDVLPALALLLAVSLLILRAAPRRPYLVVGWLWFLGTLLPISGLVQIGAFSVADRYTYLPHVGLFLLLIWGLYELCAAPQAQKVLVPAAVAVLLACVAGSIYHELAWHDSRALWTHGLEAVEASWLGHNNLGLVLLAEDQPAEALPHFQRALDLRPGMWEAASNAGLALRQLGRRAEAGRCFAHAVELHPDRACAYGYLADFLAEEGKHDEALPWYAEAVRVEPTERTVHVKLGSALLARGRAEEAEASFRQALSALPDSAELHGNLGAALYNQGKINEAIGEFEEAVRLDATFASGHHKLGVALQRQGRLTEAMAAYEAALRLNPQLAEAHSNLGTAWEAQGKLDRAIACYRQAVALAPAGVGYHCNLAAALWARGEVEAARAEYAEASRRAPAWPTAAAKAARVLATDPDPRRRYPALAVRFARQAWQGGGDEASLRETLQLAGAAGTTP